MDLVIIPHFCGVSAESGAVGQRSGPLIKNPGVMPGTLATPGILTLISLGYISDMIPFWINRVWAALGFWVVVPGKWSLPLWVQFLM